METKFQTEGASAELLENKHEEESTYLVALRIARLVKFGCGTASAVLLLGAVTTPAIASDCCRQLILTVDSWVWVAVAIGTLMYFVSGHADTVTESYTPLNDESEDENRRYVSSRQLERTVFPTKADSYPMSEAIYDAGHLKTDLDRETSQPALRDTSRIDSCPTPSDMPSDWPEPRESTASSAASAVGEVEPQQPLPTSEMCVQTEVPPQDPSPPVRSSSSSLTPVRATEGPVPERASGSWRIPQRWDPKKLLHNMPNPVRESKRVMKSSQRKSWGGRQKLSESQIMQSPQRTTDAEQLLDGSNPDTDSSRGSEQPPRETPTESLDSELSFRGPVLMEHTPLHNAAPPADEPLEVEQETVRRIQAEQLSLRATQPRSALTPPGRLPRCCCFLVGAAFILAAAAIAALVIDRHLILGLRRSLGPRLDGVEHYIEPRIESIRAVVYGWSSRLSTGVGMRPSPPAVMDNLPSQWHTGEWSTCSEECGTGEAKRVVYCISGDNASCEEHSRAPPAVKPCTEHRGCQWHIEPWGKCDSTCGPGHMVRRVTCARGSGCKGLTEKPPERAPCSRAHGCKWEPQVWQECNATCGRGSQRRAIACKNGPLESCFEHGNRPEDSRPCQSYAGCKWKPDEWSRCTNSCGTGMQHRNISCANGDEEACKKEGPAPQLERACRDSSGCLWELGNWSNCSSSCGVGTQTRQVSCKNGALEDCRKRSAEPTKERSCYAVEGCRWSEGTWSFCIAECGTGYRKRSVSCANGAEADCQNGPAKTPMSTKPCINVTGCQWHKSPWGPCSNVCGRGRQFRTVSCGNGRLEDCQETGPPPDNRRDCKEMSGCSHLQAGPRCNCRASDSALTAAGVFNALSGWTASFMILHEMVNRVVVMGGMHGGVTVLLSPPAILIAGIGALAAASVLRSYSVAPGAMDARDTIFVGSQLTIGFLGIALWALSLCFLGATVELPWKATKPVHCASAIVLLTYCVAVLLMSRGYAGDGDQDVACTGPGCATG
uniref:Uncharacterized protein n=1 Tax=Pyrodinium bahamense TaxID=73915 RepID=A0A7S0FJP9_9DINO|mmetsp:Transcript_33935/g.93896  ORF Transcript_33935/g.93896 Transcript_33935/m.93896 type:complete len:1003 (+) Transcript_33935:61-3069(+)